MAKNRSGLILTIKAYGHGQKVTHGGESAANDLLLRGEGIVNYRSNFPDLQHVSLPGWF